MRVLFALLLFFPSLVAAPPYPPEPVSGSLVIVGGGKMPDAARDEFLKLAGGAEKIRLASGDAPYEALATIDEVYPDRPDRAGA